jgi:hypothetical protein
MKLKILAVTFLAAGLLSACGDGETTSSTEKEPKDIKELVSDYSAGKIKGQNVSITSQELIIAESDGNKQVYDLSEEDFFVSIAPYENETHP